MNINRLSLGICIGIGMAAILMACTADGIDPENEQNNEALPTVFEAFSDAVNVYVNGANVVIESNGVPNHGSPYFNQNESLYEAYNGTNSNFHLNPNRIEEQDLVFTIPLNPSEAGNKRSTSLGPIGVSINGIPFFNQYAAGNAPLTNEINSFDQYNGHPQNTGSYHYHIEPRYLTATLGKDALLGFLLDGFPVYGPEEGGRTLTNEDLDEYHGHFSATKEYPDGIYHYHFTATDPYLNGGEYFGTPGSVTQ